jgi:hypothetical protein
MSTVVSAGDNTAPRHHAAEIPAKLRARLLSSPRPTRRLIELINCPNPNPIAVSATNPAAKPEARPTQHEKNNKPRNPVHAPTLSVFSSRRDNIRVPVKDPRKKHEIRKPA